MSALTAEQIAVSLPGCKKTSNGWLVKCPAHDDSTASLHIKQAEDGRILLHCFAGCDTREIVTALGLTFADLRPDIEDEPMLQTAIEKQQQQRKIYRIFDYTDERGALRYQVVRYDPKDFRQRRPLPDGKWLWSMGESKEHNLPAVEPLPFNLAGVLEALREQRLIFIVEGELKVQALAYLGLVGTCNHGGAGNWNDALNKWFTDADLVIIPDNDEAGRKHEAVVRKKLGKIARRIRTLVLPDVPDKGDIVDWVKADPNRTGADLIELLRAQHPPEVTLLDRLWRYHETPAVVRGFGTGYRVLDETVGGFEPGELLVILAFPNTGKSLFVSQMLPFLGGIGGVIPSEMTVEQWKMRLVGLKTGYDTKALRRGEFEWEPVERAFEEIEALPIRWYDEGHTPSVTDVKDWVNDHPELDWLMVDSLHDVNGENGEGIYDRVNRTMGLLHDLTKRKPPQKPLFVIATGHVNRATGDEPGVRDALGSSVIEQKATGIWIMHRPGHQNAVGNGGDSTVPPGHTYIRIAKSRFSEVGMRHLYILGHHNGWFGFHESTNIDLNE